MVRRAEPSCLTPVRAAAAEGLLAAPDSQRGYRDGAEERLLEIVSGVSDLSSLSDELVKNVTTEIERYHLSMSRANVIRALALDGTEVVLEVGAGCGSITRFLGEQCRVVDAIEPVSARAQVARERTRDLDNVQVLVGSAADVPQRPAYDLVVAVGVLEYVGDGAAEPGPYLEFLAGLAATLKPGGRIVCAIENQLGVKYLAGSPEDHTGRVFDGLERYPHGSHARLFSRDALEAMFEEVGLRARFLHAFPDYKLTRVLLPEATLADSSPMQSLAWQLPRFPSYDVAAPRPRLADEARLWRTLVEAGLARWFSNSFVVVASHDDVPPWPDDVAAVFYNTERRAAFCTETVVRQSLSGPRLQRRRLQSAEPTVEVGDIRFTVAPDAPFVVGSPLIERMADSDVEGIRTWARRWADLVRADQGRMAGTFRNVDLLPDNCIVDPDGGLVGVDAEWWHREFGPEEVIQRGLLSTAVVLSDLTVPEVWDVEQVLGVATTLGAEVGLDDQGEWITSAVEREAKLLAAIELLEPSEERRVAAAHRERIEGELRAPLESRQLGRREHEWRLRLAEELERVHGAYQRLHVESSKLHGEYSKLHGEYSELAAEGSKLAFGLEAELHRTQDERAWLEEEVSRLERAAEAARQQAAEEGRSKLLAERARARAEAERARAEIAMHRVEEQSIKLRVEERRLQEEICQLRQALEETRMRAEAAVQALEALRGTRTLRYTALPRRLYAALRR